MLGRTLGHYNILEKLGTGGMGEVYRAEDTTLKRQVALKVLAPDLAASPERLERFQREAEILAALDHPNIVTVFSVERDGDVHFLTMQLVEGQQLSDLIPTGGMTLERLLEIALPLVDAVSAAHAKGATHRDLKPANVMLSTDGRVKVLDFGLAKLRPDVDSGDTTTLPSEPLTGQGRVLGTVPYMSPEQARGEELDARTDVFSLGVVLYEMATGRLPFKGGTNAVTFDEILHKTPASPTHINADLPEELDHIVSKALEKDRSLRYRSADDLLADLKRLSRDTALAAPGVTAPAAAQPRRGRRVPPTAGLAALAILAAFALWYLGAFRARAPEGAPPVEGLDRSIAVLPFENLSGDPDQTYFSDGLSIEMIAQLSKISSLDKVIAFASSRRYRDSRKSIREIGQELGAALLLNGAVRQQGERVRVTVQLIDAQGQGQLWADTYEGELSDIFAVQSRIAEQIAAALQVELTPTLKAQIERRPTRNLTAYSLYLKGQDFHVRYNKQANENAIDFFQAALDLDADFALARAGLAYACALQGYLYGGEPRFLDTAVEQARRALASDPDLADAHVALAAAYTIKGWLPKALAESKTAVDLSPNSDKGFLEQGWVYAAGGRWDEAYDRFAEALARNPKHAYNYWSMGLPHLALSDFGKVERWARKALELQPDDTMAQFILWTALWAQGRPDDAADTSRRMLALSAQDPKSHMAAGYSRLVAGDLSEATQHLRRAYELAPETLLGDFRVATSLGGLLWQTGERDEASKLFAQSLALDAAELRAGNQSSRPMTDTAFVYAARGNTREALRWLRKAVDAGYVGVNDPAWRNLHGESQFTQMKADVDDKVAAMLGRIEAIDAKWSLQQYLAAPGR